MGCCACLLSCCCCCGCFKCCRKVNTKTTGKSKDAEKGEKDDLKEYTDNKKKSNKPVIRV